MQGLPGISSNTGATGYTGIRGMTGPTGPMGESIKSLPLPTQGWYIDTAYTGDITVDPYSSLPINFDTQDTTSSYGIPDFFYDAFSGTFTTGFLTNLTTNSLTILVSGQVLTDNTIFDLNMQQPMIQITKNGNAVVTSSVLNFYGSTFSATIILGPTDMVGIQYVNTFSIPINILSGQFKTTVSFTQLNSLQGPTGLTGNTGPIGPTGYTGNTGPAGVQRPLQSVSYYLTTPIPVSTGTPTKISYDTLDASNSYGTVGFSYSNGSLTSSSNLTILISGQVTTDNRLFDVTVPQPTIIVSKGSDPMLTSSVINFQGSSFSTTIVLGNADTVSVFYAHSFSSTVNVLAGKYVTRVTFTQLDAVQAFAVAPSMSIVPANGNTTTQLISPINRGSTFLITASSNSLHGLSSSLGVQDENLYVYVKNASTYSITMCNVTSSGSTTLAAYAPQAIVYWLGTEFKMYV
jgi:hypothetical protein